MARHLFSRSALFVCLFLGPLLVGCGGTNATGGGGSSAISSVAITPQSATVAAGLTQQFKATATLKDGATLDVTNSVTWASSSANVATISSAGLATTNNQGTATITATDGTVSNSITLTVGPAVVSSIAVSPSYPTFASTTTQQFAARGYYTDGSVHDVTSQVTWSSSATTVATISASGVATGASPGTSSIQATIGSVTSSTTATVSSATLTGIAVSPSNPQIAQQTSLQMIAIGSFSDGSTQDMTSESTWTSGATSVATIASGGNASGVAAGNSTITATVGSNSGSTTLTVTNATLVAIDVTPSSYTIPPHMNLQFHATGTFSNSTQQDLTTQSAWVSSNTSVATIDSNGLATGIANGTTAITATKNGITSQAIARHGAAALVHKQLAGHPLATSTGDDGDLLVTSATLLSIAISPSSLSIADDAHVQLYATGIFSDNSTIDLTDAVDWTSNSVDAEIANGMVIAHKPGNVTIQASGWGKTASISVAVSTATLTSLTISPADPRIASDTAEKFTAIGTFSNQTTEDLTDTVEWSTNSTLASVNNDGTLDGFDSGQVTVTASLDGISASTTVNITSATIQSISILPANITLAIGTSIQLQAIAKLSDGSTEDVTSTILWSTSSPSIAISDTGLATAIADPASGSTQSIAITAADDDVTQQVNITLSNASLVSIAISPQNPTIALGSAQQFTATGTFSDGTTQNLTNSVVWGCSSVLASIFDNGIASAISVGSTTIQASEDGVSVTSTLNISAAAVVSIAITPANASFPAGTQQQFTATATLSDTTTQNVTSSVIWTSSNPTAATISSAGLATGLTAGTGNIQAAYGVVTASVPFTVSSATLVSVSFNPPTPTVAVGNQLQMTATGYYTDGSTQNVTNSATWNSSNSAIVQVSGTGVLTGNAPGSTTVTATLGSEPFNVLVSVSSATIASIAITPATPSAPVGDSLQLTATAIYSDSTTQDVTASATWSSSNSGVASVSSTGLVTAASLGTATIQATYGSASQSVAFSSIPSVVTSVTFTPPVVSVAAGLTQQLTATAYYSNGSSQNVTSTSMWTTSNSAVATVSASGLVTTHAQGLAEITGTYGSSSSLVTFTVGPPQVVSFGLTPSPLFLALGQTQQITATASFTDGSTQNVSSLTTWTSSNPSVAIVSLAGFVTSLSQGSTQITGTFGSSSSNVTVTVGPAVIASVAVTPTSAIIANGLTQQFVATANYTDGTTQNVTSTATWSSSNTAVATVAAGLATTHSQGTTTIQATQSSVASNQVTLQVGAPTLVSIAVTLANSQSTSGTVAAGFGQQFVATGTYTDGSTQNISSAVTWSSTSPAIATVSSSGLAAALAVGSTNIQATASSITGSAALSVTPATLSSITVVPVNTTLSAGLGEQFSATGTFSDGSTQDLTLAVTWSSSNSSVVAIAPTGLAVGAAPGTATITATSGSVSGSTGVTVTSATLSSIAVAPAAPSIAAGTNQQFTATGTYSDGSTQNLTSVALWTSQSPTVATILPSGLAHALLSGSTVITATVGSVSSTSTLTVTSAQPVSVTVGPPAPSFAKGNTQQFTALVTFTDGTTQDLTSTVAWTSSNFNVVTINSSGLATGKGVGTATVTATIDGVSGQSTATVSAATLVSIAVTPATPTIALGLTQQFTATATYSDSSTQDISSTATWTSSLATTAVVNSTGLATSAGIGVTTITARSGLVSGTALLTVTTATLSSITVTPSSGSCAAGFTLQMAATGHYTDSSTQNLTAVASWTSSNGAFATVSASGLVTCKTVGTPTITATLNSISGGQSVTVTNAVLQSITVTAFSPSIALGLYDQITATGHYSDGSTQNITSLVSWTVSNAVLAIIDSNGDLLAVAVGNVTVTATYNSISGNVVVQVIL